MKLWPFPRRRPLSPYERAWRDYRAARERDPEWHLFENEKPPAGITVEFSRYGLASSFFCSVTDFPQGGMPKDLWWRFQKLYMFENARGS